MVTCALGNSFCTAIAMTWEAVWRTASDSLVRGWILQAVLAGEILMRTSTAEPLD